MAIDTPAKRNSAIATRRLPWFRRFAPIPDGTIDQADRQQVAFMYGGVLAGAAFVATHSSLEFASSVDLLHFSSSGAEDQLEFSAKGPNG